MSFKSIALTVFAAVLAVTLSASAAGPATAPAAPKAVQPADVASVMHPTGEKHERGMQAKFMQRIQQDNKFQLLLLGDSVTQGWANPAPMEVWKKYFGQYDTANFGDSGSYTQHVLWHIENGALEGINPKAVVLMIGINNLYHSPGNTPEQTAAGVKKIIDTIHEKLPQSKVLVVSILPYYRGKEKDCAPVRKACAAVNAIIAKFDDGQNVRYLDLWDKFTPANGGAPTDLLADGVHPTPKGYDLWAATMKPVLDEMMGAAAAANTPVPQPIKP